MKRLFLLVCFSLNIFASTLEVAYENLNNQFDSISSKLVSEDKANLSYLILLTHDKILSQSNNTDSINAYTLNKLTSLPLKNKNITQQEIQQLTSLYIDMIESDVRKESSTFILLLVSLLSILVVLPLSYFIVSKKFKKQNKDLKMLAEDLQNKNTHLHYKLETVNTLKDSFFEESKKEFENYEIKIKELQEKQVKLD